MAKFQNIFKYKNTATLNSRIIQGNTLCVPNVSFQMNRCCFCSFSVDSGPKFKQILSFKNLIFLYVSRLIVNTVGLQKTCPTQYHKEKALLENYFQNTTVMSNLSNIFLSATNAACQGRSQRKQVLHIDSHNE